MQRKEQLRRNNEKYLSQVRSRVLSQKELHKSRMSSWKDRLSTEVSAIRQESESNCRIIASNERLEESKKHRLAESVRSHHKRSIEQRKSIEEDRRSMGKTNRQ